MNRLVQFAAAILCITLLSAARPAQAADSILTAIPSDALAFAVVHDLDDASTTIDDLAKLVGAPEPNLLALFKNAVGLEKGFEESGELAVVLTSIDPAPRAFFLLPVSDYDEFVSGLGADDAEDGVVEVQMGNTAVVVGRKGSYAAITRPQDKEGLEEFIANDSSTSNEKLASSIEDHQVTAVLTRHGVEIALPKLISGVQMIQGTLRQMGGDQGEFTANAMNMYIELFTAAQGEVDQFAISLGVDDDRTVTLVKRVEFTPDGDWANWAADVEPAKDQLAGLPAEPFIAAMSMVMPADGMEKMMEFSLQMLKSQLSEEQASRYIELTTESMKGVRSMRFLMGVPESGTGLYGNAVAVMTIDDSERFMESYKNALNEMEKLAGEVKSPFIPKMSAKSIEVDGQDGLEVTTKMTEFTKGIPGGGPDMQKMMELFMGPGGEMKIYLAPAGDDTVAMAYTSLDRLKSELQFLESGSGGLANDEQIKTASEALPAGAQFVAYVSPSGIAEAVKQLAPEQEEGPAKAFADMPPSPPIGMAGHVAEGAAEFRLVITADTLKAIGETVAKARGEQQ